MKNNEGDGTLLMQGFACIIPVRIRLLAFPPRGAHMGQNEIDRKVGLFFYLWKNKKNIITTDLSLDALKRN